MTDYKVVLHYNNLEDSLVMENGCLIFMSMNCHTDQIEEPGVAVDEAACLLCSMLAAHQP